MGLGHFDFPLLLPFYFLLVLPIGQTQPETRGQGSVHGDTYCLTVHWGQTPDKEHTEVREWVKLGGQRDGGHKPAQLLTKMSKIIFGFFFFLRLSFDGNSFKLGIHWE